MKMDVNWILITSSSLVAFADNVVEILSLCGDVVAKVFGIRHIQAVFYCQILSDEIKLGPLVSFKF